MKKFSILPFFLLSILMISLVIPTLATTYYHNSTLTTEVLTSTTSKLNLYDYYTVNTQFRFYYPRIGMPAIVLNGSWFEIKFFAPSSATGWQFFLVNDLYNVSLSIIFSGYANEYFVFNVSIPSDVEPMLYDLEAKATVDSQTKITIEPHAVRVYHRMPENLTFVHITDTHVRDIWYPANTATQLALLQINLLHPDFVILSGDIVDYGSSAALAAMRRMLTLLQVPIFVGPGNHDLDTKGSLSIFETYIAPKNYSVVFGSTHIVSLDVSNSWYVPPDQVTWLNEVLSLNKSLKIVFFHYPPLDASGKPGLEGAGKELVRVFNERNVTLVLTGHIHRDSVFVINGTNYVTTTTTGGTYPEGFYHGYRIITYENEQLVSYGYNGNNSRAVPFEEMSVDWNPLPGNIDVGAKIKIVNNLHLEFNASFYVKLTKDVQKTYVVKNATLVDMRDGITSTVAYLSREIKEGDSIIIRVHPENPEAPTIENIDFPESVGDYEAFSIVSRVSNPASGVERVELHYVLKTAEGLSSDSVRMTKTSGDEYKASFSGFAPETNFTFYIVAYDYSGLSVKSEQYTIIIGETKEAGTPVLLDMHLIAIMGIAVVAIVVLIFVVKKQRK